MTAINKIKELIEIAATNNDYSFSTYTIHVEGNDYPMSRSVKEIYDICINQCINDPSDKLKKDYTDNSTKQQLSWGRDTTRSTSRSRSADKQN